jgi:hypothetical protein
MYERCVGCDLSVVSHDCVFVACLVFDMDRRYYSSCDVREKRFLRLRVCVSRRSLESCRKLACESDGSRPPRKAGATLATNRGYLIDILYALTIKDDFVPAFDHIPYCTYTFLFPNQVPIFRWRDTLVAEQYHTKDCVPTLATLSTTMPYTNKCMLLFAKDYAKKPWGLKWRSNTLFIVTTVGVGLFTDLFLYGLVVPILPSILRDKVGVSEKNIQSDVSGLLAAYAAASVVTSPFAGILADRLSSRQAPFLVGLLALLMATVLLFVGTTIPVLTIARVLQGVSAAFVWTVGLALVLETVGPKNLGKTIGSVCKRIQTRT